jgi:ferredoxin
VRTVFLSSRDRDDTGVTEKVAGEIGGWIRSIRRRPPTGPRHLRPRLLFTDAALSRRELLTAATVIRHEVIPAVDPELCVGSERCRLCVKSCSLGAVSLRGGSAVIDQRGCAGCGACVGACPVDAIRFPGGTKEEINACLEGMLAHGVGAAPPRIVAFTCARWAEALPPPYLECPLPCVGLLTPWAILRALSLGADGVAVITGDSPCRERHEQGGWERETRVAQRILEALGVRADRVVALDASTPRRLSEFVAALGRMSPIPWRGAGANGSPPLALGNLVSRMVRATNQGDHRPQVSPEVPFASIEVEPARCSLCGLCALCPTGALALREERDRSDLSFHYSACTGCGLCREICPEKAIRLTPMFGPARFLEGPRTLAGSCLVRCQDCGTPIAPAPMLDAIARRMASRRGAPGVVGEISRLCPDCRLAVPVGGA